MFSLKTFQMFSFFLNTNFHFFNAMWRNLLIFPKYSIKISLTKKFSIFFKKNLTESHVNSLLTNFYSLNFAPWRNRQNIPNLLKKNKISSDGLSQENLFFVFVTEH